MNASELKDYLLEDTNRIAEALELYGFHGIWFGNGEIRCASPSGENKTAVSIKLEEPIFATSYGDEFSYRGDILGLLQESDGASFSDVMYRLHRLFNLPFTKGKKSNKIDLLKDMRKYKKGKNRSKENQKFDKSILSKYIDMPHVSMIEEAITPNVMQLFNVMYDPQSDRIIFPHFDIDEFDKVVGLQGRTTLSSIIASELGVPKYLNLIKGYKKSSNLFGYNVNYEQINKDKVICLFEGEKSVMKRNSASRNNLSNAVAIGGHAVSKEQVHAIVSKTSIDTEVVICFDKDVMADESYLIDTCKLFSKFRRVSYVIDDKFNLLEEKDSPTDRGVKKWEFLFSDRREVV